MTLPELAIAIQAHPFSHTTTFLQLDDGRLLHASFRAFNYSSDGGLTWTEPQIMKDVNGNDVGGSCTSLVKLSGKNQIGLAGQTEPKPGQPMWEGRQMLFWRSDDNGKTWQPPVEISAPHLFMQALQDVLLRTSSGRIVLPCFTCLGQQAGIDNRIPPITGKLVHNQWATTGGHFYDSHFTAVIVYYSDDDGRTWQRNQDDALMIRLDWSMIFSYTNEPTVTEVKPGRLLMFMRNGLGRIFQAWSNDNGDTWTVPQPTVLASGTTPSQLRTLPNGHLLCVWNQESGDEVKRGYNRTRLSSALSRDGGRVWEFFQNIESIHETTRVEPGPIEPTRPAEVYFPAGQPAAVRDPQYIEQFEIHTRHSYPSVWVGSDRVIVAHSYHGLFKPHPTEAKLVSDGTGVPGCGQQRKILPLKWFYGGKQPADNPFLKEAYAPAKP